MIGAYKGLWYQFSAIETYERKSICLFVRARVCPVQCKLKTNCKAGQEIKMFGFSIYN